MKQEVIQRWDPGHHRKIHRKHNNHTFKRQPNSEKMNSDKEISVDGTAQKSILQRAFVR